MRYLSRQIVFREIPTEISLSYLISGCQLRCRGCHSADSWNIGGGELLTPETISAHIERYRRSISCVLFMGGEWHQEEFIELLSLVKSAGLKTALYTGRESLPRLIVNQLDYVKLGPYIRELGGLDSPTTNQRLIHLRSGDCLNHYFLHNKGEHHDSPHATAAK